MTKNTQKQQRFSAELELIIEEFGQAMRAANRGYICRPTGCSHDDAPRFTPRMESVWYDYVTFCQRHAR